MSAGFLDSQGIKEMQGSDPSRSLFLAVTGTESGWLGSHDKLLLVKFRGVKDMECSVPLMAFLNQHGKADSSLSIFVTGEGYQALTSDWCGRPAHHWNWKVFSMLEAIGLQGSGATIIE